VGRRALYVKAGLEDTKAALLVIIGALKDGRKVVLAVESGQRESTASWARVLRDLRDRGLRPWKVTVADGHLGIWGALRDVALGDAEQRCWNHSVPGRAHSWEVRGPPPGKTFKPGSLRQVAAA
jgi:transposase-like protein